VAAEAPQEGAGAALAEALQGQDQDLQGSCHRGGVSNTPLRRTPHALAATTHAVILNCARPPTHPPPPPQAPHQEPIIPTSCPGSAWLRAHRYFCPQAPAGPRTCTCLWVGEQLEPLGSWLQGLAGGAVELLLSFQQLLLHKQVQAGLQQRKGLGLQGRECVCVGGGGGVASLAGLGCRRVGLQRSGA
jgi:hypothetical protein